MNLKVLLPFQIFTEKTGVSRIVAETRNGSVGFLEHRRDCVVALVPGVLIYEIATEQEIYVAADEGVLVKAGADVFVSVRRALSGTNLANLRQSVEEHFRALDNREQEVRLVTAKVEAGFLQRFAALHHD